MELVSKGQIVIPKKIRDKLGLKPRKPIILDLLGDHAEIRPVPNILEELRGALKDKPSAKQALIEEHQKEVKQDEKLSV